MVQHLLCYQLWLHKYMYVFTFENTFNVLTLQNATGVWKALPKLVVFLFYTRIWKKHKLQVSCFAALCPFMVNIPSHDSCILMFWKCSFPSIYPCFLTDKINSKQLHYIMSLVKKQFKTMRWSTWSRLKLMYV